MSSSSSSSSSSRPAAAGRGGGGGGGDQENTHTQPLAVRIRRIPSELVLHSHPRVVQHNTIENTVLRKGYSTRLDNRA